MIVPGLPEEPLSRILTSGLSRTGGDGNHLQPPRLSVTLFCSAGLKVGIWELLCRASVAKSSGTAASKKQYCLGRRRTDLSIRRLLEEG